MALVNQKRCERPGPFAGCREIAQLHRRAAMPSGPCSCSGGEKIWLPFISMRLETRDRRYLNIFEVDPGPAPQHAVHLEFEIVRVVAAGTAARFPGANFRVAS